MTGRMTEQLKCVSNDTEFVSLFLAFINVVKLKNKIKN